APRARARPSGGGERGGRAATGRAGGGPEHDAAFGRFHGRAVRPEAAHRVAAAPRRGAGGRGAQGSLAEIDLTGSRVRDDLRARPLDPDLAAVEDADPLR